MSTSPDIDSIVEWLLADDELYYLVYDEYKSIGWAAVKKAAPVLVTAAIHRYNSMRQDELARFIQQLNAELEEADGA